ncbi:hypothetical protein NCG89_16105 [Spongiibacter taiwanensis]|uniref:hypothetical protein n=1 Tax=Spongiibacter taiwanensis TaxID=1748242 RepID=UPI0020364135|nr:hypothetical protein [Spongiibacter taiwanensis]USA43049.1 hypothetical protein NCG89_16105 [Spongiibacter taiwanensis]
MTLMLILSGLFLALLVVIPLIERYAPQPSTETQNKLSRWILPLVAVGLVLAMLRQCGAIP